MDGFAPNFGTAVGSADEITCTKFLVIGKGVWGVENWHLPLTKPVAGDTGLAQPRSQ